MKLGADDEWRVWILAGRMMRVNVGIGVIVALFFLLGGSSIEAEEPSSFPYISPRPGAIFVPAGTTIAIRQGELLDERSVVQPLFTVVGSVSGLHRAALLLADDGKTVIFKPEHPFAPGETVTTQIAGGLKTAAGKVLGGASFQFTIAPATKPDFALSSIDFLSTNEPPQNVTTVKRSTDRSQWVTLPDDFPTIEVNVRAAQANQIADGSIFLASYNHLWSQGSVPYLLILDNSGEPIFYRRTPEGSSLDFKKQPNGLLSYFSHATNLLYVMDSTYTVIDTYQAGNGYQIDHHDFQLLPNGHALLMIWDAQTVDMSQIVAGGNPAATVIGLVIQELDSAKNVVFQWSSWDHFEITDTQVDLTAAQIAYVHGNTVELDVDGNILISSRAMDEITKIDRETGNIIWRFGGKKNEFILVGDDPFFHGQHDIRRLPNGNVMLYDNREGHFPQYSRAVEYQLNEEKKIATLVWQYRSSPGIYGAWLGSAQRLPNGNTLIGWGSTVPTMTEVTPDGAVALQLSFPWPIVTYRAFRFPWSGTPPWPPTLVMKAEEGRTTLHYSWNGATEVAAYHIYAGATSDPKRLIDVQKKTGFEESTEITDALGSYCFFWVIPLDRLGNKMQSSNVVFTPGCEYHLYLPFAVQNE